MMTAVKASSARDLVTPPEKTVRNGMETGKKRNSLLLSGSGAEPWKVLAPLGSFPRYREPQNGKSGIFGNFGNVTSFTIFTRLSLQTFQRATAMTKGGK